MDKDEIFTAVDNKKFTEFETAIKTELDRKLSDNETMNSYKSDFEKIQDIKDTFATINKKYS